MAERVLGWVVVYDNGIRDRDLWGDFVRDVENAHEEAARMNGQANGYMYTACALVAARTVEMGTLEQENARLRAALREIALAAGSDVHGHLERAQAAAKGAL